jgi:hypothetical protein
MLPLISLLSSIPSTAERCLTRALSADDARRGTSQCGAARWVSIQKTFAMISRSQRSRDNLLSYP